MVSASPFVVLDRFTDKSVAVFANPLKIITAENPSEVVAAFKSVHGAIAAGHHVAGYMSYELGYVLEERLLPLLPESRDVPLLWFGVFDKPEKLSATAADAWFAAHVTGRAYAGPLRFEPSRSAYAEAFKRAKAYIDAGDIYQVNLTIRGEFAFAGDPLALYAGLRMRAAAPHAAYVFDGTRSVLSLSPEQFFSVRNGVLTARPMKGTSLRGATTEEDGALRAALLASEKDRAENLMIVDLIRNDLSRVSEPGSVRVAEMFAIESFPSVHQMVSTVTGNLRAPTMPSDLVRALFPCGSITGTPKIRAEEIIRELEPHQRGVYCGAVGGFAPDGSADFNVAIRTLTISGGRGVLGIGSAVVADSQEAGEYEECLLKSRFYSDGRIPISLIETLLHDPARGFVREALHLDRMARSASVFGLEFDRQAMLAAMRDAVAGRVGPTRVRLELSEEGRLDIKCESLPAASEVLTYALSPLRLRSGDLLARHKTGWRALYDQEFQRLRAETGCDQVIFLNERDELVEGNFTNLFVKIDGGLVTPPLSSGALAGCLRRELIESGACREGVLRLSDLEGDTYLGNSLRDLLPAVPIRFGS